VFFATSHGKYPCDGIGGMVKQQHPAFNCRGSVSIFTESISVIKKFFISNNKLAPLCLFLAE